MPLYIVVRHRAAVEQGLPNKWGTQGRIVSVTTTDAAIAAAEQAKASGSRVFLYEVSCPHKRPSHISQELSITNIDPVKKTIAFDVIELLYRKPPFRASQATTHKVDEREPTDSFA